VIAERFAAISLEEMDDGAGLRERIDAKYLVGAAALCRLLAALAPTHRALTIDGRTAFGYRSVYFDSPALAAYREHLQGRRRRWKCRTRRYEDGGPHMLEVKLKAGRGATRKHRRECPPLGDGPLSDEALAFVRACVAGEYGRWVEAPMVPVLTVRQRRTTLAAPELGERVTIDRAVRFAGPDGARGRMREDLALVESKSRRGRGVADRALRDAGVRPAELCSKFCLGIALTRPGVRTNRLRPLLTRGFTAGAPEAGRPGG